MDLKKELFSDYKKRKCNYRNITISPNAKNDVFEKDFQLNLKKILTSTQFDVINLVFWFYRKHSRIFSIGKIFTSNQFLVQNLKVSEKVKRNKV